MVPTLTTLGKTTLCNMFRSNHSSNEMCVFVFVTAFALAFALAHLCN